MVLLFQEKLICQAVGATSSRFAPVVVALSESASVITLTILGKNEQATSPIHAETQPNIALK